MQAQTKLGALTRDSFKNRVGECGAILFNDNDAVVVLAATNRPDVLDPALMRPDRLDRKVTIEKPSRKARESILKVHAEDKPLANDVDLSVLADRTAGFSGADIQNLLNEAALLAGRERRENIDMAMLNWARDRLIFGAESDVGLSEQEKRVVAYHESGHALMAYLLPRADALDKVTIIPRGRALGATEPPEEERYNMSERDLCDRIGVMLGGHMTEKLVFGEVTTGVEQDLRQVTELARRMVASWGMNERIGPVSHRQHEPHPFLGHDILGQREFSERTAYEIDAEIRKLVANISEQVYNALQHNRDKLDTLARELMVQETLEIDAIRRLLESEPTEQTEART